MLSWSLDEYEAGEGTCARADAHSSSCCLADMLKVQKRVYCILHALARGVLISQK